MEKLFQISDQYAQLDPKGENLRRSKLLEQFINEVYLIRKVNNFSRKEMISQMIKAYLEPTNRRLNLFLIIQSIWQDKVLESELEKEALIALFDDLLLKKEIDFWTEYYLECLLDIWSFNFDSPIPIEILMSIIIKPHAQVYSYGALIKAISYLDGHPQQVIREVMSAARNTNQYRIDSYYRSCID